MSEAEGLDSVEPVREALKLLRSHHRAALWWILTGRGSLGFNNRGDYAVFDKSEGHSVGSCGMMFSVDGSVLNIRQRFNLVSDTIITRRAAWQQSFDKEQLRERLDLSRSLNADALYACLSLSNGLRRVILFNSVVNHSRNRVNILPEWVPISDENMQNGAEQPFFQATNFLATLSQSEADVKSGSVLYAYAFVNRLGAILAGKVKGYTGSYVLSDADARLLRAYKHLIHMDSTILQHADCMCLQGAADCSYDVPEALLRPVLESVKTWTDNKPNPILLRLMQQRMNVVGMKQLELDNGAKCFLNLDDTERESLQSAVERMAPIFARSIYAPAVTYQPYLSSSGVTSSAISSALLTGMGCTLLLLGASGFDDLIDMLVRIMAYDEYDAEFIQYDHTKMLDAKKLKAVFSQHLLTTEDGQRKLVSLKETGLPISLVMSMKLDELLADAFENGYLSLNGD